GVYIFGGTTPADACYIQITYDILTGNATMGWGAVPLTGNTWLVGYSVGGPSSDPGPSDLSAAGNPAPILTSLVDQDALSLTPIGFPVQGAAPTVFRATTRNIPATAMLHVGIVGLTQPGTPLFAISAPNCLLNASPEVLVGPAAIFGIGPNFTWTAFNLPALTPNFFGFQFHVQGAILGTPTNPAFGLGLLTSNGLKCVVGGI
ncbi:MAG: hypothetical protein ABIP94_19560, partial [Planctomycetota bacterium]